MPASRWAKIFSPFDALKGFSEAVSSKEVQYVSRIELDADSEAELSRKLEILHNLTWNGRMAKANHVMVSVKFFIISSYPLLFLRSHESLLFVSRPDIKSA